MGKRVNKYGLSDVIPPDVKRIVRKRDGFGCVKCGCIIVQYEHIEPEFSEAMSHEPEGITLLCSGCHGKKTQKWRSPDWVKDAMRDPYCIRHGFSFDELDAGTTPPIIHLAGNVIDDCLVPLSVNGHPIISLQEPEEPGGPYRLSAEFYNEKSERMLTIENNEWRVWSGQWDVEAKAGRVIIRSAKRSYSLDLQFIPREGIRINTLEMRFGKVHLRGNARGLMMLQNGKVVSRFKNCVARYGVGGFEFSVDNFNPLDTTTETDD